jgi:hypothetical protein
VMQTMVDFLVCYFHHVSKTSLQRLKCKQSIVEVEEVEESALPLLERIEQNLIPDPINYEDAYNRTWDVIIDLHGHEYVRVSEDRLSREREKEEEGLLIWQTSRRRNLQWRTLSLVGRVLIHFDQLMKGVLREDAFASSSSFSKIISKESSDWNVMEFVLFLYIHSYWLWLLVDNPFYNFSIRFIQSSSIHHHRCAR